MTKAKWTLASGLLLGVALVAACTARGKIGDVQPPPGDQNNPPGDQNTPPGDTPMMTYPFEANTPSTYVSKVKNLLTGLPATPQEVMSVTQDPTALGGLIDQWMMTPEYKARLLIFFKQAFQQTQVTAVDYQDQLGLNPNAYNVPQFIQAMEEMFPRTALELISEGRPFTEVVTTNRFMLTPPLMNLIAWADTTARLDSAKPAPEGNWQLKKFPGYAFTIEPSTTPIALTDSINPQSANFMHWSDTTALPTAGNCRYMEPATYTAANGLLWLEEFIIGFRRNCGRTTAQFSAQDWQAWRMVTVRPPNSGEEKTLFWDIPTLENATELVVDTPHVGFMTTPAFFANWPTNTSNQARVTTNQTMIVALGHAFDDRGVTVPVMSSSGDQAHAQPGTPCYGCHQTLDPMRDFFRQSYTYFYSNRYASGQMGIPQTGTFTMLGSTPVMGTGIGALANAIVSHPRFAITWTQKLCRFANSVDCSEDDPEFMRIASDFQASNFDFNKLVHEIFSSPLITYATSTKSAQDQGVVVSIARRDSLCTTLSNRLGTADICGIWGIHSDPTNANLASAVPSDAYARGAEAPLLPTDPDLFFQSGTNNLCIRLAEQLVDVGKTPTFSSANTDATIHSIINVVMGLPDTDVRVQPITDALTSHYMTAMNTMVMQTGTPVPQKTIAMRSTFVVACTSPNALSSGL
jgi:hypothetical protein